MTEEVTNLPETELAPVEKQMFQLDDGTMASRSAYIRQEFKKDRNRGEIAKELAVAYYVVYSATTNMYNAAHPEGAVSSFGSRGTMVSVDVVGEDGVVTPTMMPRTEAMRRDLVAGMTRGDIAKKYDCPYATVYAATKEENADGTIKVAKKMIEHPVTGELKPRVEVIRELYEADKDKDGIRRIIADLLHVDYAVVWAATKAPKEPSDEDVAHEIVEEAEATGIATNQEEVEDQE